MRSEVWLEYYYRNISYFSVLSKLALNSVNDVIPVNIYDVIPG